MARETLGDSVHRVLRGAAGTVRVNETGGARLWALAGRKFTTGYRVKTVTTTVATPGTRPALFLDFAGDGRTPPIDQLFVDTRTGPPPTPGPPNADGDDLTQGFVTTLYLEPG